MNTGYPLHCIDRLGTWLAILVLLLGLVPHADADLVSVTKSFSPDTIATGGNSTLTIIIQNRPPPGVASNIAFTDTYPANLKNAAAPNVVNTCGGSVTAAPNGTSLRLTGGSIAGNQSCSVSVSVTSSIAGSHVNSTGTVTSSAGSVGPATATLTVTGAPTAPGGFNAFETGTPAGSTSGVIRTKVAANAFAIDVVALDSAGTAVQTAFAGSVKVELVDATSGVACASHATIRNLGTLAFSAADHGRKTLGSISEPEAWPNVRVRMSYPATGAPSIVACSTDALAIRPASFGNLSASDADSASAGTGRTLDNLAASGGVVHRAGRPFSLRATAYNAVGTPTAHYTGNPLASFVSCLLPASACAPGILAAGVWTTSSGTLTSDSATYGEVGAFTMKLVDTAFTAVDAGDGSSIAERQIESAPFGVGRFVPDHFDLATASVPQFRTFNDATCPVRSFTYVGQPFGYVTLPQATIMAKNAGGALTLNYAGPLWKLVPLGTVQTYTVVTGTLDISLLGTPTVTGAGGGKGTMTANPTDELAFVRSSPVAPFLADITLSMSVQDIAENSVSGNGTIDTAVPAQFPDIAFDAGNQIRFGQLVLSNAHGSELLGLPVPIETRYWNGSGFVLNTADFCTQLSAADVALGNWQRDLNSPETTVTLSGRFKAGRGNLRLSAPGAGNSGSVDLCIDLGTDPPGGTHCVAAGAGMSYLQGKWAPGTTWDNDPVARASFGLYRGSRRLIYMREMY